MRYLVYGYCLQAVGLLVWSSLLGVDDAKKEMTVTYSNGQLVRERKWCPSFAMQGEDSYGTGTRAT